MKFRLRPARLILIILFAILLALLSLYLLRPESKVNYITTPVAIRDLEKTVLADGTIEAQKLVSVGAQASGQIKTLPISLGDKVTKGQLLAEIDDLTQQNAFKDSQAALKNVQAQRAAKLAVLKNNQIGWQRQEMLMRKGVGAQADYDSAKATLDATQAEIAALDAQIIQAQIAVSTAQVNLGYTRILSPIDGTIVAIPVEEGQTVNAAQSTPTITKVANLKTMTIEAQISEADVIKVKPGMSVWFTILGDPDKRYQATLRAIEPAPESLSSDTSSTSSSASSSSSSTSTTTAVYYNGLFDVDNPEETLRISMTAQVYILLDTVKNALVVPMTALHNDNGKTSVQVVDAKGDIQSRLVTTGISDNVFVQLTSGVNAGEQVIVSQQVGTTVSRPGRPPMGF
ncbi:efflux RND transporter periplasmic adaptor subunit [Lonsdalea iberica]|uniref:Efflux transporter periplasmic adaptor subunit n=1 Tax=Lonsdalea iberica TaxID=1082703 RepID=A0A1X3RY29_9GAMM|nr:efflux RND transporter periplasmic adaptor subunit [Lonsdalea iberica]OSN06976.1 efflux transporter periplasmic adaptor subunit [Lonsdalea iberica]